MKTAKFLELVREAIDDLPEEIGDYLDNVDVVVTDVPTRAQLMSAGVRSPYTLLGLYEGVPHTQRGAGYNLQAPDKITLFQRPIESVCRDDAEIRQQVRHTLLHELAHHFGFDEDEIRELERELERNDS